ncbi:MAG TPA: hypothetical protein VG965_03215 [Patescibacteria group bacterium]|nr:hypothetical protein [Patescibacteria group bacterium]
MKLSPRHRALKLLFSLFIILYSLFFIPIGVNADSNSFSLSISPSITEIVATPPASVESRISIENKSGKEEDLNISFMPFKMSKASNGNIEYINGQDSNFEQIRSKISIYDGNNAITSVKLNPYEEKDLKLKINIDDSAGKNDYYFSVVFAASDNTLKPNSSQTSGGIATNIILTTNEAEKPSGHIADFSTPFFENRGPVPFTLLLVNDGDHYMIPRGRISLKDMFGRDLERIDIKPEYILGHGQRYLTQYIDEKNNSTIKTINQYKNNSGHPILIWPQTFLFGIYNATAVIKLSDSGPTFTTTTSFISMPIYLILPITIFSAILLGIYIKVKQKSEKK